MFFANLWEVKSEKVLIFRVKILFAKSTFWKRRLSWNKNEPSPWIENKILTKFFSCPFLRLEEPFYEIKNNLVVLMKMFFMRWTLDENWYSTHKVWDINTHWTHLYGWLPDIGKTIWNSFGINFGKIKNFNLLK